MTFLCIPIGWSRLRSVLLVALVCTILAPVVQLTAAPPVQTGHNPDAILLAQAVPEARQSERGIFFQYTLNLRLETSTIRLASSADGNGWLCTDDRATVTFRAVDGRTRVWIHTFASADRRAIICIAPQTIRLPGDAGSYQVTITLENLYPPAYHSSAYYLIVEPNPTPVPPTRPEPTVMPLLTPVAYTAAGDIGRVQPALTPLSTPTSVPDTSAVPHVVEQEGTSAVPIHLILLVIAGCIGLLGLLFFVRAILQHRSPPGLVGILDLSDRGTGEARTLLLHHYPVGAGIVRHPLDLVAWPVSSTTRPVVAVVMPDKRGPLLTIPAAGQPMSIPLSNNEALLLDQLIEVRYRP